jgi:aconitate hydratase
VSSDQRDRSPTASLRLRVIGNNEAPTGYLPSDSGFLAAPRRKPLIILAGKEHGSGSSRDWAAKGTALLGVHVVVAESYERIHRFNLIGMGVLPLEFIEGESAESLGLSGEETFEIIGLAGHEAPPSTVQVLARDRQGQARRFEALVRIDTPVEAAYYRHGGILQYMLRRLLGDVLK